MSGRLFDLGHIVATPGSLTLLEEMNVSPSSLVSRHASGDWGDLSPADTKENERSLKYGFRLLSSYTTDAGKVWIITEADRSSTCLLLPEEY